MKRQELIEIFNFHLNDSRSDTDKITAAIVTLAAAITEAGNDISNSLNRLGNNDAATQMGAIENLAKELREGLQSFAAAVDENR